MYTHSIASYLPHIRAHTRQIHKQTQTIVVLVCVPRGYVWFVFLYADVDCVSHQHVDRVLNAPTWRSNEMMTNQMDESISNEVLCPRYCCIRANWFALSK